MKTVFNLLNNLTKIKAENPPTSWRSRVFEYYAHKTK